MNRSIIFDLTETFLLFIQLGVLLLTNICVLPTVKFSIGDTLIFGSETKGLPNDVLNKFSEGNKLFIPMVKNSRSLNLSNAVSIVIYEAWRQQKFKNSELFNEK